MNAADNIINALGIVFFVLTVLVFLLSVVDFITFRCGKTLAAPFEESRFKTEKRERESEISREEYHNLIAKDNPLVISSPKPSITRQFR